MSAAPARLERLQGALADIALESDVSAFRQDPVAFAAARGLEPGDARAFQRWQRRLLTYRALVRFALQDPLPDCFPIAKALLGEAWEGCVDAFLETRAIQSPYYRHIHPHFVEWLAESGWGAEAFPCLLSLAHFEYVELDVLRAPEDAPQTGFATAPSPERRVRFSASARNLAYPWRVHEATEEQPLPAEGLALLFCHRLPDGRYQQRELGGVSSAFLTRLLDDAPMGEAAEAVELDWDEAAAFLEELRAEGAVLGYA
ncbi:MAG TPA: putative DNA-binding domain-containing protein, partial [Holophagaceae bacterium]|nr:putative DNA-binding domain-containing protein [Holophagaceae bacterium]